MDLISSQLFGNTSSAILLALYFLALILAFVLFRKLLKEKLLPKKFNIAILGHKSSGKTTMITRLFAEVFANRVINIRAELSSKATVERVNQDIKTLEKKEKLKPTKVLDIFGYSSNIFIKQRSITSTVKLTIGDFPGEFSESYFREKNFRPRFTNDIFVTEEFYDWCTNADAYIFFIDIAKYLSSKPNDGLYISNISTDLREGWQKLLLAHREREESFYKKPLIIIFNKADLFNITTKRVNNEKIIEKIQKYGFEVIPDLVKVENDNFELGKSTIIDSFTDLIAYFENQKNPHDVIFTSSFGYAGKNDGLLNFNYLVKEIFKKSKIIDEFGNNLFVGIISKLFFLVDE